MEIALGRNVGTEMESAVRARAGALQDARLSPLIATVWVDVRTCIRARVSECPCASERPVFSMCT